MGWWGNAVVVAGALTIGLVAFRGRAAGPAPARAATQHEPVVPVLQVPVLEVPLLEGEPDLDGELGDAIWQGAVARTGAFLDASGAPARPYSDARVVALRDRLIVALYAADEDIRTTGPSRDLFRVTLGGTTFEVTATGELHGAPAGTRIGHDLDGTPDDPSDDDEEWVLELAIPRAGLGERVALTVERCDSTRDGTRSCSSTRQMLVLDANR